MKIIIELDVSTRDPGNAFNIVDGILDDGILQDAINEHPSVLVMSAISRAETPADEDTRARFLAVMAVIAQGAMNITEGLTTIEPNSRVHKAMHLLCEMVTNGTVGTR